MHSIFYSGPIAMAQRDREEGVSRTRRKKGPKKPPVKAPKTKKSPATILSIIVAVIFLIWAILPKESDKGDSSKAVPAVLGILDQVYMGCTVYWYQKG
jgi:amino acid transporter